MSQVNWLEPPSIVLMEDPTDGGVGGVSGDGKGGVPAGMYKQGGLGDGILHLVDGGDHLQGDGELPVGAEDVEGTGQHQVRHLKIPDEPLPGELQGNHPGAVAVDPGSASTNQVVLGGGEVAGGDAGPREHAGGGAGVNQHRYERELICKLQQASRCLVRGSGQVPGMDRSRRS